MQTLQACRVGREHQRKRGRERHDGREAKGSTFMEDGIGGLVPSERFFGEVLVALGKALHFGQPGVQGHGWVIGVLGHVEVRGPAQLLLDHQRLLQQLGAGGKHKRR